MGQSFDSQPVIAVRGREPSPLRQEKGRHARLEKGGLLCRTVAALPSLVVRISAINSRNRRCLIL